MKLSRPASPKAPRQAPQAPGGTLSRPAPPAPSASSTTYQQPSPPIMPSNLQQGGQQPQQQQQQQQNGFTVYIPTHLAYFLISIYLSFIVCLFSVLKVTLTPSNIMSAFNTATSAMSTMANLGMLGGNKKQDPPPNRPAPTPTPNSNPLIPQ
jgi:hypothetical protein